jgi:5-methylcytosine-specific restriction protein B
MAIATDYVDRPGLKLCYSAARRAVERTLQEDDSLFTPGQPIWSLTNIRDLYDRFVRHPDTSADTFETKFRRQLNGAPAATIQLAGELLYVHFLVPADMSGQAKRTLINEVLSWSPNPVTIPDELATTLDDGFVTVGMAYKIHRVQQLRFMLDLYKGWKQLDDTERARLLKDPWAFKTWVCDIPVQGAQSQREALLHIVHPKTFEDIVSQKYKSKIANAFHDRVSSSANDVDRQLLEIRQSLTAEAGHPISYYAAPLRSKWLDDQPPPSPPSPGPQPTRQRAWLVRGANVEGQNLVPDWLNQGYCSVRWEEIGNDVARGTSRSQITSLVNESYPDDSPRARHHHVGNLDRFLNQMSVGDLVVTADGSKIYVGTVTSDPEYLGLQGGLAPRRRQVHWANPTSPIGRDELSAAAFAKLRTLLTVSEVTDDIAEYAQLADIGTEGPTEPPPERIHLPQPDEALTERLLLPQEWLAETVELLDEKRQVVFYGPPGTGKTWTAMRLATYLTQSGGEVLLVQFHPSYAYEDFVEGFRPQAGADGPSVQFELVPGPLRQLADLARADRAHPYILIIDEINRANLAKVFGELYFLLEYRDQSIALQYSPSTTFTLPDNLFVIGTMNTADRSIALVDAAMRRRFYFIPFLPSEEPIKGLLRRWLERRGLDETPADLIEELNRRIDDPEAAIGPSYLMAQSAVTPAGLKRVWRHAILPLLAEQYYGHPIDLERRFGYDSLLRAVTAQPEAEGGLVEDSEPG